MEPPAAVLDNPSSTTQSPTTEQSTYSESNLAHAAYLCVLGFECSCFDGLGFQFENRAVVAYAATNWSDESSSVQPMLYEQEKSRLRRMKKVWEREHNPPSPEDREPFVMIPKSFALDESLSAAEVALGVRLAALSDKDCKVYAKEKTLQKKYLKGTGINPIRTARSSLVKKGYLEKDRPTGDDGRFTGCTYAVTPKLRRRTAK